MAARVEAVFELRLGGAGFADVREFARNPTGRSGEKLPPWEISDGQLRRYIAAADKLCKERIDARADHLLARHLLRRERLYAHALEIGDYKTALAVLKDEAELERLYDRDDHSGNLEAFLALLPAGLADSIRRAIAATLAGGGAGGGGKPAALPAPPGPESDPQPGGDDPGPLAGGVAPLFG